MTPLKIVKLQQETGIDLLGACILEFLSTKKIPTPKKFIINPLDSNNISSPATTHKYLSEFKKLGYVIEELSDKDKRFTCVQITDKGKQYLKKWGVK